MILVPRLRNINRGSKNKILYSVKLCRSRGNFRDRSESVYFKPYIRQENVADECRESRTCQGASA